MTKKAKESIKKELVKSLISEAEIEKIILFGSFIRSENPNDLDVAIFQTSKESYLKLALKYRRLTRNIARRISMDIIPIKSNTEKNSFLSEIESGEVIYEK